MVDSDLAELYRVETKALNRAVKRNPARFPLDFMFRLTETEAASLRCQIGTSNDSRGGRRYLPYAFTEHGVAMLSSVLNSERAAQMNILIVRAFVKLRDMIARSQRPGAQDGAVGEYAERSHRGPDYRCQRHSEPRKESNEGDQESGRATPAQAPLWLRRRATA